MKATLMRGLQTVRAPGIRGLAAAVLVVVLLAAWVTYSGEGELQLAPIRDGRLKVGIISNGAVSDFGWTYSHQLGRQQLGKLLAGKVETEMYEKVPESADCQRALQALLDGGARLIFLASFGYQDHARQLAGMHRNVVFMQCFGTRSAVNVGTFDAATHEVMFALGVLAGRMTRTGDVGFVGAHPIPQVIRNLNAFTLGARSVRPGVHVHVIWTNCWSDPQVEEAAASSLIELGADVLANHLSTSINVVKLAESKGVPVVGYAADLHHLAPKMWLGGLVFDWGKLYARIAQDVIDGKWRALPVSDYTSGGVVTLASFGATVPATVQAEIRDIEAKIATERLEVFAGPLADQTGKTVLAQGEKPSPAWLEKMDFLVAGVQGTLPGANVFVTPTTR